MIRCSAHENEKDFLNEQINGEVVIVKRMQPWNDCRAAAIFILKKKS